MSLTSELSALQKRLGHEFASPRLLERALTHRSFSADHNERLEFLGDSVLNLAVSGLLYKRLESILAELENLRADRDSALSAERWVERKVVVK